MTGTAIQARWLQSAGCLYPSESADARLSRCQNDEVKNDQLVTRSFLKALTNLFEQTKDTACDRYYWNMSPYFYTSFVPSGRKMSGADCAQQLMSGVYDGAYTIPMAEMHFIIDNAKLVSSWLHSLAPQSNITMVSLGCGPASSILNKDIILAREIRPSDYVAVDINYKQARCGAGLICDALPVIHTSYLAQDFTKKLNLQRSSKNNHVFMSLLGGTIAQYSCADLLQPEKGDKSPLKSLLRNFGTSTGFSASLLATFDIVTKPSETLRKYQGDGMLELIDTFWATVKHITGDKEFAPCALTYQPEFDEETSSVEFVCRAKKETSIRINGTKYRIRKNDEYVIGCSQKMTPEQALPLSEEVGFKQVPLDFMSNRSTTASTRALMLVGKNVPA